MTPRIKVPTCTTLVLEALRRADDFMTLAMIRESTGLDTCHASASLHHLRKHKAIECMESDGQLWWYATPDTDDRSRSLDERTPENKPRKPRKSKIFTTTGSTQP